MFKVRERNRIANQQKMAQKIVTSCQELAFAKDRYQRIIQEKEAKKQQIIAGKLKPKGNLLLAKK